MQRFRSKKGFTLVEALVVVAIIAVLGTIIVLSIVDYLRSTTKLEYDGYAKSLFIAAQNHLTMAEHEGFLGKTDFGVLEDAEKGIYRIVVQKGSGFDNENSVQSLILPFGSVDETVRNGSYIIRYQKSPAQILDVFYWTEDGRYSYSYSATDFSSYLWPVRNDKDKLRNYDGGSIIGYYGGADEGEGRGAKLDAPQIQLINAERLYVLVNNANDGVANAKLKLVIHGETSGHSKEFNLVKDGDHWVDGQFRVVLDSVTDDGKHFAQQFCDASSNALIAGEDIKVYAVAYNDQEFTNVAFSSEQITNSLFGDSVVEDEGAFEALGIANVRHLENLDPRISDLDAGALGGNLVAAQTADFSWVDFAAAIDPEDPGYVAVYGNVLGQRFELGCYEPISPGYSLTYEGRNHTIADLPINKPGWAGLFGEPMGAIKVTDLKLQDFDVTGREGAGTLAGRLLSSEVCNVLVCQSSDAVTGVGVTATNGYAGGLVAEINKTKVEACAAAVYVTSNASGAGGLIGKANESQISGCYSAGFTEGGAYGTEEDSFNVTALSGSVGGLVADVMGTEITYSYSTCSVYGEMAGGLVGKSDLGVINYCYCTGLVRKVEGGTAGAFAASLTGAYYDYSENKYFSIINGGIPAVASGETGASAFDTTTATYRAFVSTGSEDNPRSAASPYDDTLIAYYQGKYNLRTVYQLGFVDSEPEDGTVPDYFVKTHYGDWPAPETLVVNTPTSH